MKERSQIVSSAISNMQVCSADWLRDSIEYGTVLILDCQSQLQYQRYHITDSLRVNLPPLLLRRLKKGNLSVAAAIPCTMMRERFEQGCKSKEIVICDSNYSESADCGDLMSSLYTRLATDKCRVRVLNGGVSKFRNLYPECITGETAFDSPDGSPDSAVTIGLQSLTLCSVDRNSNTDNASPQMLSQIIKNLYLGNAKCAMDQKILEKHNIKYVLNVTPNIPNSFEHEDDMKYMQIPINDHWSQNLSVYFARAIEFIDEGRASGQGVLVHCLAGISRSCTITVAYLMKHMSLSLNDAYDHVKRSKPDISPNFNFMGQLLDFEQTLLKEKCKCENECKCIKTTSTDSEMFFMSPTISSPNYELERFTVDVR